MTGTPPLVRVERDGGVRLLTICRPPGNYLSLALAAQLRDIALLLANDREARVVLLQSDVPGFFIAHADLEELAAIEGPPVLVRVPLFATLRLFAHLGPVGRWLVDVALRNVNPIYQAIEALHRLPAVTIALVEGRVGGVGSELSMALDMRFGASGLAVVNQLEGACGAFPGAGGTQRLPRLLGPGRASEVIFGSDDLDAETAERWGYFNRVLPKDEIRPFVYELAARIARFPPSGIRRAKQLMRAAVGVDPTLLRLEALDFIEAVLSEPSRGLIRRFVERSGQHTNATRLGAFNSELHK